MADWVLQVLIFLVVAGSTSRFTNRTAGSQRPGSRREPRSSPGQLVVYRMGDWRGVLLCEKNVYIHMEIDKQINEYRNINMYVYIYIDIGKEILAGWVLSGMS